MNKQFGANACYNSNDVKEASALMYIYIEA